MRTVFAVTGGLPAYVQYFDNGESIDTNIINLFFSVTGALFEETQYILHRDMKNITGANAILTGLASLERPYYVELLQESQIKSGTFTSRLNDLMSMGLVGRIQASSRGTAKYADYHSRTVCSISGTAMCINTGETLCAAMALMYIIIM